jgi:hypothetical protein
MNKTLINGLLSEMSETLEKIAVTAENKLLMAEQSCMAVQSIINRLNEHVLNNAFNDEQEEIHFFKEIRPQFLKEKIYYAELFYLENDKPVGRLEAIKDYYTIYLDRVRIFFDRNESFYMYYRTGKSHFDAEYYLRGKNVDTTPHVMQDMDNRLSTLHSFKLSKVMAYEVLVGYLQASIQRLGQPEIDVSSTANRKRRRSWTDSKAALIELAYAIHSRGSVNHGKDDVKDIITDLEMFFDVQVGNFYRTFQSMRIRKKKRTLYLDTLKESLERRMDDTDMNFA